jgi:hypothetical protein
MVPKSTRVASLKDWMNSKKPVKLAINQGEIDGA